MLRTQRLGLGVVLLCALQATAVRAFDGDADVPPAKLERIWYGWQILAIDGLAFATWMVTGAVGKNQTQPPLATANLAGLGVYMLGAPIVHAVRGKPGAAIGSFAIRALPMSTTVMALAVCDDLLLGNTDCLTGFSGLSVVMALVPVVLDLAVFAYEPAPDRRTAYVEPWFDPTGAGLVLNRTF